MSGNPLWMLLPLAVYSAIALAFWIECRLAARYHRIAEEGGG